MITRLRVVKRGKGSGRKTQDIASRTTEGTEPRPLRGQRSSPPHRVVITRRHAPRPRRKARKRSEGQPGDRFRSSPLCRGSLPWLASAAFLRALRAAAWAVWSVRPKDHGVNRGKASTPRTPWFAKRCLVGSQDNPSITFLSQLAPDFVSDSFRREAFPLGTKGRTQGRGDFGHFDHGDAEIVGAAVEAGEVGGGRAHRGHLTPRVSSTAGNPWPFGDWPRPYPRRQAHRSME